MKKSTRLGCSLIFLLSAFLAVGCGQSDQEATGLENREPENVAQNNDGKNNNQNEYYTSAQRNPERATSIEEGGEDMDVLTPEDPVMAYADYHTVEFNQGVAGLSAEEEKDLNEFIASLDKNKPAYITIRMEDADTLDVTEPTPEFKKLTATRVSQVTDFFKRAEVEVAEVKVDESGVVETPGEDRALARENNGNGQLVVITIDATESDNEPSESIPHLPEAETIDG